MKKIFITATAIAIMTIGAYVDASAQSARHSNQVTPARRSQPAAPAQNGNAHNNQPAPKPAPAPAPDHNQPNHNVQPHGNVIPHGAPRTVEPRRNYVPNYPHHKVVHAQPKGEPIILHNYMKHHPAPPCRAFTITEYRVGNTFAELPIGYKYVNINGEWLFLAQGYIFRPLIIDGSILFRIIR